MVVSQKLNFFENLSKKWIEGQNFIVRNQYLSRKRQVKGNY